MELEPKRILLVEDDRDTLTVLRENLKRAGYQVVEAQSGEEGLVAFKQYKPDLVILDVALPGIDGWEVLRRIKAGPISRKTPVVMLTGKTDNADRIKGYEIGADFYMTKPYNVQKLLTVVRSIVREQKGS